MRDGPGAYTGSFVPFTIIHTCSTDSIGEPRFGLRLIRKNHEPDTTDDLDASKLNQHVTRLLDLRDPDHSERTPGRPEWSLRQQLFCDVRGYRRYIGGHGFPCRCLSPSEVCVPPVRKLTGAVQRTLDPQSESRGAFTESSIITTAILELLE